MEVPKFLKDKFESLSQNGVVASVFNFFCGRSTFFAIMFGFTGMYGWLVLGRDLTSYALFVTAMQTLIVLHSWNQDKKELLEVKQAKLL